ncbi:MAG: OstA-like protein, partial [Prevotellaceae bacterium]|nr:OstA-like protein [Prevotellaceae bacterium]
MTINNKIQKLLSGHRTFIVIILCLFGLCVVQSHQAPKKKTRKNTNERVYLVHADVLRYDQYGPNPTAQVLNGNVAFTHKGARLTCDSAYFYQESNSFRAFGHVKMLQGDTLSLFSDYAYYDGNEQMAEARYNVVLKHRKTTLYTDSLNYDRLYGIGYFFEGGKMIDKDNVLVSDWGEYDTETRHSVFNYDVHLKNPKFVLTTDTLHYDTRTSVAHIVGPSKVVSGKSTIYSSQGYYDTNKDKAELYGRSRLTNEGKELIGDSLYYDEKTGVSEGFRNVIYTDTINKNELNSDYFWYNENTGYAYATDNAVLKEFSQKDTLYMHADTMKVYTYNINTDSVWRKVHCYNKVRAYRTDIQAVCDSLVYSSKDSCMTMYK